MIAAFKAIAGVLRELTAPPDPQRFAVAAAPTGWNPPPERKEKKRSGNTVFLMDEDTNTYGFADKPFETAHQNQPEGLTERDIAELKYRKLDVFNPGYAAAKAIFAKNPGVSKRDLSQQIPGVAKETFKDVLAAFRAAAQ